ncbi:MAG: hypothetical protein FJ100_04890, partial [Deltaproteobacteria bacterium]|nr:hypothetical protein [Deltaproteobacteria bacterium]
MADGRLHGLRRRLHAKGLAPAPPRRVGRLCLESQGFNIETNTSGAGNYDGWLVKFNAGHVQQFAVTDGGTRRDNFNRVIV